jgi:hypothetical protein
MSLKAFVNNKAEWDAFCQELDDNIAELHKRLEQSEHVVEIHKTQGGILALRRLKYLRDKVNGKQSS